METQYNIDLPRLRADLRALAEQSKQLKHKLRRRWTAPMGAQQYELVLVRRRTTRLLILRAALRGKLHLQSQPREFSVPGTLRYYEFVKALENGTMYRIRDWDLVESQRRIAEQVAAEYAPAGADAPGCGAEALEVATTSRPAPSSEVEAEGSSSRPARTQPTQVR